MHDICIMFIKSRNRDLTFYYVKCGMQMLEQSTEPLNMRIACTLHMLNSLIQFFVPNKTYRTLTALDNHSS